MRSKSGFRDIPVEYLQEDTLDIGVYIDSLSEFILECDTPMTIAIQGDWGSGKTSMMNLIKGKLSSDVISVWFNTWQYSQFEMQSYLTVSLLEHFLTQLDYKDPNKTTINTIKKSIMGFAKNVVIVGSEALVGDRFASITENALGKETETNITKEIQELKKKIEQAIDDKLRSESKNRVVVFIDDIDRLSPEKSVELLEVLKIFLDARSCVFVLAVDYDVVIKGLEKKFGEKVGELKGKSFFDKMIQLPFRMPTSEYNIEKFVNELLKNNNITASESGIGVFGDLINFSIGYNPRSIKRLMNTFLLLNKVSEKRSSNKEIVSFDKQKILFAVLCMQIAFEDLYNAILKDREELKKSYFEEIQNEEKFRERHKDLYLKIAESKDKFLSSRLREFIEIFLNSIEPENESEDGFKLLQSVLQSTELTSISKTENASEISRQSVRKEKNQKFWDQILRKCKDKGISEFKNKSAIKDNYCWARRGNILYGFSVKKHSSIIDFVIWNYKTPSETLTLYKRIFDFKIDIEESFGNQLVWPTENEGVYSRISYEMAGGIDDVDKWDEIQNELVKQMEKLKLAVNPILKLLGEV